VYVRYSPHLVIQDAFLDLRYQESIENVLSENAEVRVKQSSASVYVLYLYKLHLVTYSRLRLGTLEGGQPLEGGEVCCH